MAGEDHHMRMELLLERDAEPIRGWLEIGGRRQRFAGWVELAGVLERARGDAPGPAPAAPADRGQSGATDGR